MIKIENTVRFLYGLKNMYANMKMSLMQGQIDKDALSMNVNQYFSCMYSPAIFLLANRPHVFCFDSFFLLSYFSTFSSSSVRCTLESESY